MTLITRADYMHQSSEEFQARRERGEHPAHAMDAFRRYYGQFVTEETIVDVLRHIGGENLLASTDQHFNDIPMAHWDAMTGWSNRTQTYSRSFLRFNRALVQEANGGHVWGSDLLCIAKEAGRIWVERNRP